MGFYGKVVVTCLAVVLGVALFRSLFMFKTTPAPTPCTSLKNHKKISLKSDPAILDRFLEALSIPTISYSPHVYDATQMQRLVDFIEKSYPTLHNSPLATRELVSNYTLLYTIQGSNPNLEPYMLNSHLDVVPAVRSKWSTEPFKAEVKTDGFIYGRGTLDAKDLTIGILEATEALLKDNFKPERTFFLVFGHDEEIMGLEGAQEVAKIIKQRTKQHKKLLYILDEGTTILKTRLPGLPYDLGIVGVFEKGYLSLNVTARGPVGHGSIPPHKTAISKLANVLSKFHSNTLPSFIGRGIEADMFKVFASYSTWPMKFIYSNLWLFKPVIDYHFSDSPILNTFIRTTTAITTIQGGTKENVLPDSASAIIHHRIHQLQSIQEVIEFDRKLIGDPSVDLKIQGTALEPSPVSPHGDEDVGYQLVKNSILQIYPNTVVVPGLFMASTDSKWYLDLTDSIYRFSCVALEMGELSGYHGHDERLSVSNYEGLINFYYHLLLNSDETTFNFNKHQHTEL